VVTKLRSEEPTVEEMPKAVFGMHTVYLIYISTLPTTELPFRVCS